MDQMEKPLNQGNTRNYAMAFGTYEKTFPEKSSS
jgi:hypothetical protein